ncbi:MAG: type II secretion system F family protein, partial [Armatimonadota bacterium]
MPIYAYTAVSANGSLKEATIEAASEDQARLLLQSRGQRVMRLRQADTAPPVGSAESRKLRGKRPPADEVAGMVRQMSILVRAGVPLVESLHGLADQARSQTLRACLVQMAGDVSQGTALSDAFSRHPVVFPQLAVEMARVAEAGGNLAESLERLADHMETSAEIMRKIRSALAYPIVVMGISVVTVVVMVAFILPRFMKLF